VTFRDKFYGELLAPKPNPKATGPCFIDCFFKLFALTLRTWGQDENLLTLLEHDTYFPNYTMYVISQNTAYFENSLTVRLGALVYCVGTQTHTWYLGNSETAGPKADCGEGEGETTTSHEKKGFSWLLLLATCKGPSVGLQNGFRKILQMLKDLKL
jgi:hypothetical protein